LFSSCFHFLLFSLFFLLTLLFFHVIMSLVSE
jgi:hypothetical protein